MIAARTADECDLGTEECTNTRTDTRARVGEAAQRLRELTCARMSTRTSRRHIVDKFAHGQVAVNLRACLVAAARRVRMASAKKTAA